MVAVPLEVEVELKPPQSALPQVTVQATPALAESLETVAVNDWVELSAREAGGVPLRVTLMGLRELPHATSAAARLKAMRERIHWRYFIAHLRSSAPSQF